MKKQLTETDILETLELVLLQNKTKHPNWELRTFIQLFMVFVMLGILIPIALAGWMM